MIKCIHYIAAPLIGGVVGYFTNDLAIRMLFRPLRPVFLFGHRLPMTPGMIPKNKERLASGIAAMVSDKLMSNEVLAETLLSDSMIAKVRANAADFLASQKKNDTPISAALARLIGSDAVNSMVANAKARINQKLTNKMTDPSLADFISEKIISSIQGRVQSSILLSFGVKMLDGFFNIEGKIKSLVSEVLGGEAVQTVCEMVNDETDKFLRRPVSSLFDQQDDSQIKKIEDAIVEIYRKTVTEKLPEILNAIDIREIVRNRVVNMDVLEMERMILEICDKELRAVVWLGAVLGAIIGCINIFI